MVLQARLDLRVTLERQVLKEQLDHKVTLDQPVLRDQQVQLDLKAQPVEMV
jgi:hypothetical protein